MNELIAPPLMSSLERQLMLDALHVLQERTGVRGDLRPLEAMRQAQCDVDGAIELTHEHGTVLYLVECKMTVDRRMRIDQIQRQLVQAQTQRQLVDAQGLLIAPFISKELADYCREVGLQFIDTCGNAYLRAPGLLMFISGEKNEPRHQPGQLPKGLTNAAALRVVFALLSRPGLVDAPFKDIADQAGVALGTAYNVLGNLEERGYLLKRVGGGQRRLLEPHRLVDEWAINYPTTLRPKLNIRRFSAPDKDWWKTLQAQAGIPLTWGAEVAAHKMTGYLKPATQTLYIPAAAIETAMRELVKRYRLRPDPRGEVELLEQFWQWDHEGMPEVAPPLLVYSELLAILDPRTQETANLIKEKYLAFDSA